MVDIARSMRPHGILGDGIADAASIRRLLVLAASAVIVLAGCWLHWRFGQSWPTTSAHAWGSDDAYITYRYAWNLLNGWGPVYNPGEAPVEGYSNPLYLIVLVPILALVGPEHLYNASTALNALTLVATLPLLVRLGRATMPQQPISQALLVLTAALYPPLWQAAASGLETVFVYALQLALITVVLAPPRRAVLAAGIVSVLLVATRTDGFILPLALAVPLWLAGQRRIALTIAAACAGAFACLTLWRLTYYGLPLPNVVYAKVHGPLYQRLMVAGLSAMIVLPRTGIFPWLLLPLARLPALRQSLARHGRKDLARPEFLITLLPIVLSGYWLFVGGDVFFERFLLIAYPLGLLSLLMWLRSPGVALAAIVVANLVPLAADGRYDYASKQYDLWIVTGRFLGEHHPDATLAIDAAGKVPYFSRLQTLDMLGLNDRHIASRPDVPFWQAGHNKRDVTYVLSKQPDLIAAWRIENFDMIWGLRRELYRAAGYCPRYLFYTGREAVADPVKDLVEIDVAQWSDIPMDWTYMVLDRRENCPLAP